MTTSCDETETGILRFCRVSDAYDRLHPGAVLVRDPIGSRPVGDGASG